jgi:tyrosine-protein phosphatase YwqE
MIRRNISLGRNIRINQSVKQKLERKLLVVLDNSKKYLLFRIHNIAIQ